MGLRNRVDRLASLPRTVPYLALALCMAAAVAYFFREPRLLLALAFSNIILLMMGIFLHSRNGTRLFAPGQGATDRDDTDLVRRLEESEERYRTLAENFLSPVVIFEGSRITFANRLFYSLAGYTPEEVMDENFDVFSIVHEDDRAQAITNAVTLLNGERGEESFEVRFVSKTGEVKTGLTFSSIVHFDGKPAVETVVVDITRMKEMERELNRTRKRLQYLLDNAPVMIFNLDDKGNFSYANEETRRVTGYSIDEWEGQSFIPIVHPDDVVMALQKFEEGRRGGERRDYKLRIRNADGELRLLHIIAKTIHEDGEFAGSIIIGQDITEQEELERQLERDKNFIDQLIENANAMIGVTDDKGKFIVFNRRFEEVTGFSKEEAIGKDPMDLYVLEESRELILTKVQNSLPVYHIEIPIVSKTGERLAVTWSGARVNLPSGKDGIVFVGQDVTAQKRMQEELSQSKKLASIGELISGVAHELNNPLTVVIGYAQMLTTEQEILAKHRDMAQKVFDAATRSKRVVENLLAFARKKKLEKHEVNVNELMESTLSLREHHFTVNNVKIVRDYDETIPTTYGDGQQLQQVFLNLINNAFEAMRETNGGGTLEVRTGQIEGKAIMEIIDDGPGVPESLHEKIFDPFFTTKEVGKGTGLGMSLSYGIMKEHGGSIYLDKAYRDGAKLVIELPLAETAASLPAGQAS